jgi:hypothetical protein
MLLAAIGLLVGNTKAVPLPKGSSATVILQDRMPYYRGSYQAFASPWSTFFDASLVHGIDFRDTIAVDPATFPDGTIIESMWPKRPPKTGVWGYNAVSYGNYDGGRPPERVTPKQVKDLKRLNEAFSYRFSGSPFFNLLTEFYLTAKPGDETSKLVEIGLFLHTPALTSAFARSGERIGDYRDRQGRIWTIRRQGTYYLVIPNDGADVQSGTLELQPLLAFLMTKHVLSGAEWFNGMAFGVEPASGGGRTRLIVDHWHVDYQ